jgi:hypothetical protein
VWGAAEPDVREPLTCARAQKPASGAVAGAARARRRSRMREWAEPEASRGGAVACFYLGADEVHVRRAKVDGDGSVGDVDRSGRARASRWSRGARVAGGRRDAGGRCLPPLLMRAWLPRLLLFLASGDQELARSGTYKSSRTYC